MLYEFLYSISMVSMAIALVFAWKKISDLKEENRRLKINYKKEKDLSEWYKNRYNQMNKNQINVN